MNEVQQIAELAGLGVKSVTVEVESKGFEIFNRKIANSKKIPDGFSVEFRPGKTLVTGPSITVTVNRDDYVA